MKWKKKQNTHPKKTNPFIRSKQSLVKLKKRKKDLELSTRLTAEVGNAVQENDNENR